MVADCAYSVIDDRYLALREADPPYVVALKPHRGTWARANRPAVKGSWSSCSTPCVITTCARWATLIPRPPREGASGELVEA